MKRLLDEDDANAVPVDTNTSSDGLEVDLTSEGSGVVSERILKKSRSDQQEKAPSPAIGDAGNPGEEFFEIPDISIEGGDRESEASADSGNHYSRPLGLETDGKAEAVGSSSVGGSVELSLNGDTATIDDGNISLAISLNEDVQVLDGDAANAVAGNLSVDISLTDGDQEDDFDICADHPLNTGIVYDIRYLEHEKPPRPTKILSEKVGDEEVDEASDTSGEYPEVPDRVRSIYETLEKKNLLKRCLLIEPQVAEAKDGEIDPVLLVHTPSHISRLEKSRSRD
ncbi:hypothetical protein HDU96_009938 [Phlyctochytrium bullatum]|nr:hypothetical protein HDU96_009938 [Phlyctochytrium bullatum]